MAVTSLSLGAAPSARAAHAVRTTASWSKFHFDLADSGFGRYETTLSPSNVSTLTMKWSTSTGGDVWSSPAVSGGLVYVGSLDNNVYALDESTGAVVWQYATGE